jgi:hypothetical protein
MRTLQKATEVWQRFIGTKPGKRTLIVGATVAGLFLATTGAAMATRAVSNQVASAAVEKLVGGGDNPQAILDAIADKVVKQLTSKHGALNGVLATAGKDITAKLGKQAGAKLANFDTSSLINKVSDDVVAAGMGKLDGISTDAIVEEVTNALINEAMQKINSIDLEELASSTINGAVGDMLDNVDIEQLIKDKLDSIDVNAIVTKVVKDQMNSKASSLSTSSLLGLLFKR